MKTFSIKTYRIWLPLNKIAELFEKDKSVISRHITNIFEEQELSKTSTVGKFPTVQIEGNRNVVGGEWRFDIIKSIVISVLLKHIS